MREVRSGVRGARRWLVANTPDLFPLRFQLRDYRTGSLVDDLNAGANVALLTIPLGMAYASVAGLPLSFGLSCSAIAAFVAPFFASSRFTSLGPTNATALMTFGFFAASEVAMAERVLAMPVLVLLTGFFCVVGAYLKLADLLQYVSRSVLVGYVTGAAILIIGNQLKHLLGLEQVMTAKGGGGNFFLTMMDLATNLPAMSWQPLLLGGVTLAMFLWLRKKFVKLPVFVIVMALMAVVSMVLQRWVPGFEQLSLLSDFELDVFRPRFSELGGRDLFEKLSSLSGIALALAFLATLENTVMAKDLGARSGSRPDVNQDMFAVGLANLANAFVGGMVASGSPTRSALNFESGAKSGLSSIFCGLIAAGMIYLLAITSVVGLIPKSVLAGLVVGIALSLFRKSNLRICMRSTSSDRAVLLLTLVATLLLRLDLAVFIGVGLSLVLFLRKASRPYLVEYDMNDDGQLHELDGDQARRLPAISIVHVEGDLFFGAAELFQDQVQRTLVDPNLKVIVLRLKNARHLDATSVTALGQLVQFAKSKGRHILISGVTIEVYKVLKRSGILAVVQEGCARGESNVFRYSPGNPNLSTRDALRRAQTILGTDEAEIKIFIDQKKKKKD